MFVAADDAYLVLTTFSFSLFATRKCAARELHSTLTTREHSERRTKTRKYKTNLYSLHKNCPLLYILFRLRFAYSVRCLYSSSFPLILTIILRCLPFPNVHIYRCVNRKTKKKDEETATRNEGARRRTTSQSDWRTNFLLVNQNAKMPLPYISSVKQRLSPPPPLSLAFPTRFQPNPAVHITFPRNRL